jgi:hypothetical protein
MSETEQITIRAVGAAMADMVRRLLTGELGRSGIVKELRALADQVDGSGDAGDSADAKEAKASLEAAWLRIFAYWQRACAKDRSRATPERKRVVMARLKDGYTEADIKRAIDGAANSEFHAEGGYNDLTLICRNGAKLESFAERAGGVGRRSDQGGQVADARDAAREDMELAMQRALRNGNAREYAKLQEKLAAMGAVK